VLARSEFMPFPDLAYLEYLLPFSAILHLWRAIELPHLAVLGLIFDYLGNKWIKVHTIKGWNMHLDNFGTSIMLAYMNGSANKQRKK
jgi:hypothetical protein